ncbi:MAG TPA: uroporphyrinogen decarboxylase family protein [Acidobacteriota bacterium]|nr:uroporphyrinogen decarboxylase family protein [Acidobacteriota bacterium]
MNGRQRILAMLDGKKPDRLPFMPITMMYAADQIERCYRDYATDYRVLVEGQIQIAQEFDFDYVSCISDPAREASDCGAQISFFDDQPPAIDEANALLANKTALLSLESPSHLPGGRMHDRIEAAALFRNRIGDEKLIEGWIEGPCAEAADLRGINSLMLDFFDDPSFVRDLFEFVTEMEIDFAEAQIEAGVDLIGIGDAAASLVGPRIYEEFVWEYEKKMVDAIKGRGVLVRLHICGNTRAILRGMGELDCDIVDLDYMVSMAEARKAMDADQVLLGNVDPVNTLLHGSPEDIHEALSLCYEEAGSRYIVGAGCEIPRGTPARNIKSMLNFAEEAQR